MPAALSGSLPTLALAGGRPVVVLVLVLRRHGEGRVGGVGEVHRAVAVRVVHEHRRRSERTRQHDVGAAALPGVRRALRQGAEAVGERALALCVGGGDQLGAHQRLLAGRRVDRVDGGVRRVALRLAEEPCEHAPHRGRADDAAGAVGEVEGARRDAGQRQLVEALLAGDRRQRAGVRVVGEEQLARCGLQRCGQRARGGGAARRRGVVGDEDRGGSGDSAEDDRGSQGEDLSTDHGGSVAAGAGEGKLACGVLPVFEARPGRRALAVDGTRCGDSRGHRPTAEARAEAAGVGFEPTEELPPQRFSRPPRSTAPAPRRARGS